MVNLGGQSKYKISNINQILFVIFAFSLTSLILFYKLDKIDISPFQFQIFFYLLTIIFALFLMRNNLIGILIQSRQITANKNGSERFFWEWKKSWLVFPAIFLLWFVPIFFGIFLTDIGIKDFSISSIFYSALIYIFLVGLAEELFYREALVRVFGDRLDVTLIMGILFFFILHLPQGIIPSVIASFAGLVFLSLRLSGVNIFLIAIAHGLGNLIFNKVLMLPLSGGYLYGYFIVYSLVAILISIVLLRYKRL